MSEPHYRHYWRVLNRQRSHSFRQLKAVISELVVAAHGDAGEGEIPS